MKRIRSQALPFERLTREPEHSFFGYYDLQPWSGDGAYHLCQRVPFMNRMQAPEDVAEIGMIRIADCRYVPIAETFAWNFQQGTMLQWHPRRPDEEVIFNTRLEGEFRGAIHNIRTGEERILSRPVATVDPAGRHALSVNFSRMFDFRPGYGYAGIADPFKDEKHPAEDGIFLVDLESGESRLILSLAEVAARFPGHDLVRDSTILVNHITFNTDGSRFVFLLRNNPRADGAAGRWWTLTLTANTDGSDLHVLNDFGMASHYIWRDPENLLIYADGGKPGTGELYLLRDRSSDAEVVDASYFRSDGHCSYSPDRRWLLYDSYPDGEGYRSLYLYDVERRKGITLAGLLSARWGRLFSTDMRCDLHPRFNRDGTALSFDSIHEGHRHIYWMELEGVDKLF